MAVPGASRGSRAAARRRSRRAYAGALATGAAVILIATHSRGSDPHPDRSLPPVATGSAAVAPSAASSRDAGPGPTQAPATAWAAAATPMAPWTVLALGDSVPAGTACGCTPFPSLYANDVAELSGRSTTSVNLAQPGLTSAGLLAQLAPGSQASARVGQASVITVTIGANDFNYQPASSCPQLACYAGQLAGMRANVANILRRVGAARAGTPTAVLVLGYWEVWEDGQVGADKGSDYMGVNDALTAAVNRDLAAVAAAATATYVDLQTTFHRSPGEEDTDLLAPDGDHPNAAGHRAIAQTLRSAGLPGALSPPLP